MDIWAQDGQKDEAGAWLQSPLIDGKEHPFGCFSFWFTFKVSLYFIVLALLNMLKFPFDSLLISLIFLHNRD